MTGIWFRLAKLFPNHGSGILDRDQRVCMAVNDFPLFTFAAINSRDRQIHRDNSFHSSYPNPPVFEIDAASKLRSDDERHVLGDFLAKFS
jgi:hypothetical protein